MVVFMLSGCGGNQKVAAVSGVVTLDGEPLERASILFEPEKGGRPSFAVTDELGNYKLAYSRTLNGAEIGSCIVKISKLPDSRENESEPREKASNTAQKIPARYVKEPVKVSVLPQRNTIDIELTTDP